MMKPACPSSEELRSLSLGQLDEQRTDQISGHLESCQQCRAAIATIETDSDTFIASLREIPSDKIDQDSPYDSESELEIASERALAAISGTERSPSDTSHVPDVIGEYEIVEMLGQGGMGQVFRGQHVKLKRPVAIKFIAKHRMWDQDTRDRFASEMQVIGGLEHRNIVAAHDAREVDGYAVLVTEFIDGIDVGELLRRKGPLSVADACQIAAEICEALEHCDSKGFVHRDIKPSNMMVSRSGAVKLLDLGLMKLQTEDENGGFTATGQAIGTPDYVAPEQVKDSRDVDIRADIYGLGCSLYKMLSGSVPFPKPEFESAFSKMNAQLSETPVSISKLRPDLPRSLVKLIAQMLEKDPKRRPQTPNKVKQKLFAYCETTNLPQLIQAAVDSPESDFLAQQSKAQASAPSKVDPKTSAGSLLVLTGAFLRDKLVQVAQTVMLLLRSYWATGPVRACRWALKTILRELTQSNIVWMVIAGLYVLLTPLLFLEADPFNILLVVSHGLFTGWKLKREQATETNRSAFRAALWSGVLVYGLCGLLIASQARSCVQDYFFQHPYFLAAIWEELWFPLIAFIPFTVIAITFFLAVKPATVSLWRVALLVAGWAGTIVLLANFSYDLDRFLRTNNPIDGNPLTWASVALALVPIVTFWLIKRSEPVRWRTLFYGLAWLSFAALLPLCFGGIEGIERRLSALTATAVDPPKTSAISSQPRLSQSAEARDARYLAFVRTQGQLLKLANVAAMSRYRPSDAWYEELDKLLQRPNGWSAVGVFISNEPEFAAAIDKYLREKYDLPLKIQDPAKAWNTLERLGRECVDSVELERVVEMVEPAIDAQQLSQELMKFEPLLRSDDPKIGLLYGADGVIFGPTNDPVGIRMRPLVKATMLLEKEFHLSHPKEHTPVQNNFCKLAFYSTPPIPMSGYQRVRGSNDLRNKSGVSKTLKLLSPNLWSYDTSLYSPWYYSQYVVKQAPEYDQYLLRRRAWGLSADHQHQRKLGNTTVDRVTHQLLFRRSPGARKWRAENHKLLLEIALRYFADPPEKISKDERVLRSALASVFSSGSSNGPSLSQLEFLFSDPPKNNRSSLAMEFWPQLDRLLAGEFHVEFPDGTTWAKIAKGTPYNKFAIRMRYLEKMWPESTPEMFADTYFKAPEKIRQSFLIGRHATGLSETIPVAGRLQILRAIQKRVDPKTIGGIYWNWNSQATESEQQTIEVAISKLHCPAGAAAYLGLHTDETLKLEDIEYRWRNDLFDLLVEHREPKLRKLALQTIRNRPRPRFVKALANLRSDKDTEVRKLAEEVAEHIAGYTLEAYRDEYQSENETQ